MDTHEQTITITWIPADLPKGAGRIEALADMGKALACEVENPDQHPSTAAFRRAAISVNHITAFAQDGKVPLDLLVALIAGNSDPDRDHTTPERSELIHPKPDPNTPSPPCPVCDLTNENAEGIPCSAAAEMDRILAEVAREELQAEADRIAPDLKAMEG